MTIHDIKILFRNLKDLTAVYKTIRNRPYITIQNQEFCFFGIHRSYPCRWRVCFCFPNLLYFTVFCGSNFSPKLINFTSFSNYLFSSPFNLLALTRKDEYKRRNFAACCIQSLHQENLQQNVDWLAW